MAGQKQPIDLVLARGRKHLTKNEIEARRASEVKPCADDLSAPAYLTAAQKKVFARIAKQLEKIGIMGETDVDALARYVTAQSLYEQAVKDLRKLRKSEPKDPEADGYYKDMELWNNALTAAEKRQDRYYKQAQTAATALGLTISSRVRLEAPVKEEAPKENKFKVLRTAGDA